MIEASQDKGVWWGTFELKEETAGRWRIGPSTLWVYRSRHEWRLIHEQTDDVLDEAARVIVPVPPEEPVPALDEISPRAKVSRFSFHRTEPRLMVRPRLADRSIVVRPEEPLYVLEGETVTLYVSTPLWISLEVGDTPRFLQEVPAFRPSDTWFGPSTLEGELCYAVQTMGRLRLSDVHFLGYRAITPVIIHNQAEDTLPLDRLQIPVAYLSLYQAEDGYLWTESITLRRERSGDAATLHLGENPPEAARGARRIGEPRHPSRKNLIVRAFSTLLHKINV